MSPMEAQINSTQPSREEIKLYVTFFLVSIVLLRKSIYAVNC